MRYSNSSELANESGYLQTEKISLECRMKRQLSQEPVLGPRLVDQSIDCLVETLLREKEIIRFFVENTVGLIAVTFEGVSQIAAGYIGASFRL
jgi:hypothetical protein